MDKNNKYNLAFTCIFGALSLLSFLLQIGLGLWLASILVVGLVCLGAGFLLGRRVGSAERQGDQMAAGPSGSIVAERRPPSDAVGSP